MSGENALQRYDEYAFDKICDSAFGQSVMAGRLEVRVHACVLRARWLLWLDCLSPSAALHVGPGAVSSPSDVCHCTPPAAIPALQKLTFLRMGDMMIDNWSVFVAFLQRLTCPPLPPPQS